MFKKDITIVIPCRSTENPYTTLKSLRNQTLNNFDIVVVYDLEKKGANWARNKGFRFVDTEFVLFSDNDINWLPDAIETLYNTLRETPQATYSYGSYNQGDSKEWCNEPFDANKLKNINYISTMSLIRSADFPMFDEKIQRLQDWDLWLTLLLRGKVGVWCKKRIFTTVKRAGITFGTNMSYDEAVRIIKAKHRL